MQNKRTAGSATLLFAMAFTLLFIIAKTSFCSEHAQIMGRVSVPGGQQGGIHVLAVKVKGGSGFSVIREIETEALPAKSDEVAMSVELSGQGEYTLSPLPPGRYAVWAWVDVNGNRAVDHLDYLEPSGWHQSPEHLDPITLDLAAGQVARGINLTLISPTPYPQNELGIAHGRGGGSLKTIRGNKVLHLWGPPLDRAYCHGYLLARQIVQWLEYVFLEFYTKSAGLYENGWLPHLRGRLATKRLYGGELEAMLEGMRHSGADLMIKTLGREITVDDLASINSFTALPFYLVFRNAFTARSANPPLCSSAAAWGERTINSVLGGETILGKNMDGETDLRKVTINSLLIFAVEHEPESGLKNYVGIDWPGFLGSNNAMNQDGLTIVPHASITEPDPRADDFLGYALIYRRTMEYCSSIADAEILWNAMEATRVGGWNTTLAQSRGRCPGGYPAAVFEADSFGGVMRLPGDFAPPEDACSLFTTNNFFKYTGANPEAVEKTHAYHAQLEPGNYRYKAMLEKMQGFTRDGQGIGPEQMIEIMQAASRTRNYSGITEYCFLAMPDRMRFALAKEDLAQKILDAPYCRFTYYNFDEVFE